MSQSSFLILPIPLPSIIHRQSSFFSTPHPSNGLRTPSPGDHLHVYQGSTVLLQCHDFMDLPLLLSETFSGQQVSDFCQKIGARYEKRDINAT